MDTAKEMREIANEANEVQDEVKRILDVIRDVAYEGRYYYLAMHDRKFTNNNTNSLIGKQLRKLGFSVDSSDGVDNKSNNFRTIKIEW